jgi:hypothetical protein
LDFFSKYGRIAAAPYTDGQAIFLSCIEKFRSQTDFSCPASEKIIVNKMPSVADSTRWETEFAPVKIRFRITMRHLRGRWNHKNELWIAEKVGDNASGQTQNEKWPESFSGHFTFHRI